MPNSDVFHAQFGFKRFFHTKRIYSVSENRSQFQIVYGFIVWCKKHKEFRGAAGVVGF